MKIHVLHMSTFNTAKAMLPAEEIGVDYEACILDGARGEHRQAPFLELNPLGKVPVLEHDGLVLAESMAIARYLAAINDAALYGHDPRRRARVDQWIDRLVCQTGRAIAILYMEDYLKPKFFGRDTDAEAVDKARQQLARELPLYDAALTRHAHLVDDDYSLADTTLLGYLLATETTSLDLSAHAGLARWYERARQRPATVAMLKRFDAGPSKQASE